jgi:hypothetical protein
VDQATRLRRRQEAHRRVIRQRRIVALSAGGLVLLVLLVVALSSGSPEKKAAAEKAAAAAPELPRGGRTIFPRYRLVAYYGAPQDRELGELGIGTPDQATRRLIKQARPYGRGRQIMPVLELITVVASASSTDGRYSSRQSDATIKRYLAAARRAKALLLLDVQPGRADFLSEVKRLEPYLRQPDVGLALDPEWHVGPAEIPGKVIGSMQSSDVNAISAWMATIVREGNLPQKLLVVHQFTDNMIRDKQLLKQSPEVALTLNVDGFGSIPVKVSKYRDFARTGPRTHHGFKLFYREDPVLMKPRQVLRMKPQPELVVYE